MEALLSSEVIAMLEAAVSSGVVPQVAVAKHLPKSSFTVATNACTQYYIGVCLHVSSMQLIEQTHLVGIGAQ